jgi:hypothetical protein
VLTWKDFECDHLIQTISDGIFPVVSDKFRDKLTNVAGAELARTESNIVAEECVKQFLEKLSQVAKKQPMELKYADNPDKSAAPTWTNLERQLIRTCCEHYSPPTILEYARKLARDVRRLERNAQYSTASILNEAFLKLLKVTGVKAPTAIQRATFQNKSPIEQLIIVELQRTIWRRKTDDRRKRQVRGEWPVDSDGHTLEMWDMKSPQERANEFELLEDEPEIRNCRDKLIKFIPRELAEISLTLRDPHRQIYDDCVLPLLLNDSIETDWLFNEASNEYDKLIKFVQTTYNIPFERAGRVIGDTLQTIQDKFLQDFTDDGEVDGSPAAV